MDTDITMIEHPGTPLGTMAGTTVGTATSTAPSTPMGRARRSIRRFWADQRGLTVSAVILIGILVVATAAFGAIAATKIGEAGDVVEGVDFGG